MRTSTTVSPCTFLQLILGWELRGRVLAAAVHKLQGAGLEECSALCRAQSTCQMPFSWHGAEVRESLDLPPSPVAVLVLTHQTTPRLTLQLTMEMA